MIFKRGVLAGLILCLAGVVTPGSAPAKARAGDVMKKYPGSRYIVRSGSGESPEQAAEAARLEIAKYFEAKISGESLVRQWAQSRTIGGRTVESRMTEVSNTITVGASRYIPGIEIVAADGERDRYEAWAALEKEKYARMLEERVSGFDAAVERRLAAPGNTDRERTAAFAKLMRDLINRERDRQDLMLLGREIESKGALLYTVMSGLDSLIADALDVGLVFEGAADERVKSALLKGAVDAGIRVKEHPGLEAAAKSGCDLAVIVHCEVSKRKSSSTAAGKEYVFYWSDWVLSLKAVDPATGKVLDTTVLSDKVSGGSEEQAAERMTGRILQNQAPKVTSWVCRAVFGPAGE